MSPRTKDRIWAMITIAFILGIYITLVFDEHKRHHEILSKQNKAEILKQLHNH